MRKEEALTPAWPAYPHCQVSVSLSRMPYLPLLQLASLSLYPWQIASSSSHCNLNSHNEKLKRSRGLGGGSVGRSACCENMRICIQITAPMKKLSMATNISVPPSAYLAETVGSLGLAGCHCRWKISSSRFSERPCLKGVRQRAIRRIPDLLLLLWPLCMQRHTDPNMCVYEHTG